MQLGIIEHGTAGSPAEYGKSTAANVGYFAPGKWVGYVASLPYTVLTGPHPLLLARESRILVDVDVTYMRTKSSYQKVRLQRRSP